jgi:hypothetical protein
MFLYIQYPIYYNFLTSIKNKKQQKCEKLKVQQSATIFAAWK